MLIYADQNETIYPFSFQQLRQRNPHVSFPSDMSEAELATWHVFKVEQTQPEYNQETQYLNELQPALVDGVWKQQWEVLGQEIQVPQSVTKRQGRQQMILMGTIDQVQTAIDAISDPVQKALVQSFWDDSSEYERNHPQMVQLAQAIGLTEDQLDDAFIAAAKL